MHLNFICIRAQIRMYAQILSGYLTFCKRILGINYEEPLNLRRGQKRGVTIANYVIYDNPINMGLTVYLKELLSVVRRMQIKRLIKHNLAIC